MTSGFGKVILLGEHAVVYGYPALAGAVDLRVAARVVPADCSSLVVPAWGLEVDDSDTGPVGRALAALVAATCPDEERWRITASSTLPARAGLGSSAALSVAITRALAVAHGERPSLDEIEERASVGERCFHKRPSGVDVAVASRGGLGLYDKSRGFVPMHAEPVSVVVGLTGEARDTADLVSAVAAARESNPAATDKRLAQLGELAKRGAKALGDAGGIGELGELGDFFREAQVVLAELGVSSPGIDEMVSAAESAGASGAKLTGAGGGGAVIALAPGREEEVAKAWRGLGREAFVTRVGVGASKDPDS